MHVLIGVVDPSQAYPPDELDMALGYACAYTPPVHLQLRQISAYISFSKTVGRACHFPRIPESLTDTLFSIK
jgi:hypothetical protein